MEGVILDLQAQVALLVTQLNVLEHERTNSTSSTTAVTTSAMAPILTINLQGEMSRVGKPRKFVLDQDLTQWDFIFSSYLGTVSEDLRLL
jgi:hypothetical protein